MSLFEKIFKNDAKENNEMEDAKIENVKEIVKIVEDESMKNAMKESLEENKSLNRVLIDSKGMNMSLVNDVKMLMDDYVKSKEVSEALVNETKKVEDTINDTNVKIDELNKTLQLLIEKVKNSYENMRSLNTVFEETNKGYSSIKETTSSIYQITEQIKMLSMNASIEAARAGENGKGFAVVAGEVKNLSELTNNKNAEIENKLSSVAVQIEGLSKIIELNNNSLSETTEYVKQTQDVVLNIVNKQKELISTIKEIENSSRLNNDNVNELDRRLYDILTSASAQESIYEDMTNKSGFVIRKQEEALRKSK